MKKVLKRLKKLFQSREIEVGLPKKLTQIIDDYELPAILTTYDAVNPLVLHGNKKDAPWHAPLISCASRRRNL